MTPTVPGVALDFAAVRKLNRLGDQARKAIAERDDAIREAVAAGGTLREVGLAVGMSHAGVRRVIERG